MIKIKSFTYQELDECNDFLLSNGANAKNGIHTFADKVVIMWDDGKISKESAISTLRESQTDAKQQLVQANYQIRLYKLRLQNLEDHKPEEMLKEEFRNYTNRKTQDENTLLTYESTKIDLIEQLAALEAEINEIENTDNTIL